MKSLKEQEIQDLKDYALYRKNEEVKDMEKINKQLAEGKALEDLEDYREPLAVSKKLEITIELSTGGDADGYKLLVDIEAREIVSGVYYWADWGVYEEVELSREELGLVEQFYLWGDVACFVVD